MGILGKFLSAFELAQQNEATMHEQLKRMEERTNAGIDLNGAPFKPYKVPPKFGQVVPLGRAGTTLIARAHVSASTSLGEGSMGATLTGTTAKIAAYQNKMRPFWGYSDHDRGQVFRDFWSDVKEKMRR